MISGVEIADSYVNVYHTIQEDNATTKILKVFELPGFEKILQHQPTYSSMLHQENGLEIGEQIKVETDLGTFSAGAFLQIEGQFHMFSTVRTLL